MKKFSKRQIRGPTVPRAHEWSSPYRVKIELKVADPTAPALGQAPAILISKVQGWEGESFRQHPKVSRHSQLAAPAPPPSNCDVRSSRHSALPGGLPLRLPSQPLSRGPQDAHLRKPTCSSPSTSTRAAEIQS